MKKIFLLIFISIFSFDFAQVGNVGINTSSPHSSSVLDVNSSSKGLLLPRLTSAAISTLSATAAEGLVVYDKDKKLFLGWDGTRWQILGNALALSTVSIGAWEVGGYTSYGNSPVAASSSNPIVTSAILERGSGLATSGTGAAATWGGTNWTQVDLPTAAAANEFALITLNFAPGNTISFTKINANNLRRTGTGPTKSQYQFSVNNGISYVNIGAAIDLSSSAPSGNNIADIDLSLYYDLQNINTTTVSNVKFRIVSYSASGSTGNWYINNITGNDLEFTGIVN
ncbi:hypothetical protein [Frigoriflavimonas asaccharolytica]|uniref:F5/8 type C domain-containing protein n=1 Tax=Frigoriflavimonas asaccharolytica TaxID=2735899 RepID=A0A8J8G9I6_9FLAO|nr:hypothetical protein [Frigoriflavimonas asaccharolytica]NRS93623.1 hypothetical protein [Frigoriflavimonas asaccharolytica]